MRRPKNSEALFHAPICKKVNMVLYVREFVANNLVNQIATWHQIEENTVDLSYPWEFHSWTPH